MTDDLLTPEPDTYRFEFLDGIPTLRCYNERGERTTVYVEVEYPGNYSEIPMSSEEREKLGTWMDEQDNKPF